ncbi:MAG: ATP-binding protein, partial [Primorskyibacter sp.]
GNLAIRFEVSDTGCGISEHDAKIIFDEFRQVDGSMTRKAGGSGLGLTISRKLAQRLGGVLDFHSNLGVGSTFYVDIPLVPQTSE